MKVIIQTPKSRETFETEGLVNIPASDGNMGIFPNHSHMVVKLKQGKVKINNTFYPIGPGYAKIGPHETTLYIDVYDQAFYNSITPTRSGSN